MRSWSQPSASSAPLGSPSFRWLGQCPLLARVSMAMGVVEVGFFLDLSLPPDSMGSCLRPTLTEVRVDDRSFPYSCFQPCFWFIMFARF